MLKLISALVAIVAALPSAVLAQASPMDTIDYMVKLSTDYSGRTICSNGAVLRVFGEALTEYSQAHPEKKDSLSNQDVYEALAARFPCPFNPSQVSTTAANADALVGFWALVPESIVLSPKIFKQDPFPSNCEYFGFYQDNALRSMQMITRESCPTVKEGDFSRLPKVISWRLEKNSLEIKRSDIPSYVEVWEPYVVTKNFTHKGIEFRQGDLLMFMAQFNQTKKDRIGNLYFRHLRRL